jgi:ubiquinone/menaquinone biosynthesis C-methylase UbiE
MSIEKINPQSDKLTIEKRILHSLLTPGFGEKLIPGIRKNMRAIGYSDSTSCKISTELIAELKNARPGNLDQIAYQVLQNNSRELNLNVALENGLDDRQEIIFNQLAPWVTGNKLADWGSGDGGLAAKFAERDYDVTCFDIANYLRKDLEGKLNFSITDGETVPEIENETIDTAYLTNVLHHSPKNLRKIICEINRILKVGGRLLLIETVPSKDTIEQLTKEFPEIHFQDWIYNAVYNFKSGVPVPGNYKPQSIWRRIFNSLGFTPVYGGQIFLGQDIDIISDNHALEVFEKKSNSLILQ